MQSKIKKAIFPIAGLGSRFLPATKTLAKEMLIVLDRPILEWAVIEASRSGIEEMIFVTSSKKNSIIEHLENIISHSIGYYSIALTFEFKLKPLFLNPVWTVIVYSHENPPLLKSIVEINAYSLQLINDVYTEDILDA